MKRIRHSRQSGGFTRFEAIVVAGTLAVLIAVLLPALAASKKKVSRIGCTNNLKQIGLAFRLWSGDNGDKYPMQVSVTNGGTMEFVGSGVVAAHFQVMSNELSTPKILFCREDKRRTPASSFTTNLSNSNLSYFVGVDATEEKPQMFLSGDAYLAVGGKPSKPGLLSLRTNSPIAWAKPLRPYHGKGGNILLADGSVRQPNTVLLRELLQASGVATNRLAMP